MRSTLRHLNVGLSFGIAMAIRLVIGYYGGQWLDEKLGTDPWITLVGILLAIGLSFHHLISEFSKMEKEEKRKKEEHEKEDEEE